MKHTLCLIIGILFFFSSCEKNYKSRLKFSIKNLEPENISIQNYGNALFSIDTNNFEEGFVAAQKDFSYFLGNQFPDSSHLEKLYNFVTDSFLIELNRQSSLTYPTFSLLEKELTAGFRRFHKYYPTIDIPQLYSYISGVKFEDAVMTDGKAVVIGLDNFLGENSAVYQQLGVPVYMRIRMTADHIPVKVFAAWYELFFWDEKASQTILDEMIKVGKKLFFIEAMLPSLSDYLIIGYSKEQLDWVKSNEAEIWKTLVGEQLLFSGEPQLFRKLFGEGPFSQDFSQNAPARLGEWVGWQIVRKFMDQNPEMCIVKLQALTDSQEILTRSRYRPK